MKKTHESPCSSLVLTNSFFFNSISVSFEDGVAYCLAGNKDSRFIHDEFVFAFVFYFLLSRVIN